MYGLSLLKVILAAQSHGVATPPPAPAPAPAVVSAPAPTAVVAPAPTVESTPVAAPAPAVESAPVTTTTTTTVPPLVTFSNIECVVYIPANGVTFSPGPADANGSCAYLAAQYPTATITPTPESGYYQTAG